jgi:hypothetical protein
MAYTVACIGVLLMLKQVPTGAASLQWMVIAALGFTIYGPQVRCRAGSGRWQSTLPVNSDGSVCLCFELLLSCGCSLLLLHDWIF